MHRVWGIVWTAAIGEAQGVWKMERILSEGMGRSLGQGTKKKRYCGGRWHRRGSLAFAMLRVPHTMVKALGLKGSNMQKEVAHLWYHLFPRVTQLQPQLPMP